MKCKNMKFKNTIVDFLINSKNSIQKFIISNKKMSIIIAVVIAIIIAVIIMISNKTEIGNTSGNLSNSGFSLQKGGWVYYLGLKDNNTDGIYRIKENGDKKEKISSDYGIYLNKSKNFIYYLDIVSGEYNIVRMKTNGEEKEVIIKDVDTAKITIVDNWIYYFKDSNFYRAKTNGEGKQILSKKVIENYEIVGKWIYYSYINNGKYVIAKMKTNGEEAIKIDNDASSIFFVDNSNIYYIYETFNEENLEYNYELYKIKTSGEKREKIAEIGKNVQLENVNFKEKRIYYTKTDDNDILSIYSIKLNGKDENKIVDIQGYYTMLNVHDDWIYYTDQNDNGDSQIFRIRINGKDKQIL